ncbi:hypothetical protein [Sessilibacter corallicola]|uniref:hypothetical protein n=1 Tax=Sessilibacter corallicola TaxID=2904075 RepID=UPI001E5B412C|nr:hypothetical protein [Sessilibacter corallicola]MCE2029831.1 hypothetical protein [Sessilibacter corallicola]
MIRCVFTYLLLLLITVQLSSESVDLHELHEESSAAVSTVLDTGHHLHSIDEHSGSFDESQSVDQHNGDCCHCCCHCLSHIVLLSPVNLIYHKSPVGRSVYTEYTPSEAIDPHLRPPIFFG